MSKIRVLHLPLANTGSGVTQYIRNAWKYIDKSRFHFDFATRFSVLDFEDELTSQGSIIHRYEMNTTINKHVFRDDLRKIMANGYDVVHLHTSWWSSFIAEEVAKELNISKIIVHSHNTNIVASTTDDIASMKKLHEQNKKIFSEDYKKYATHLCSCSEEAAVWLYENNISNSEIILLPNFIDANHFKYDLNIRTKKRKQLGLSHQFVIGHVGRFVYQKNHEFIIRAFSLLLKSQNNSILMLVGSGELLQESKDLVVQLGIENNVIFMGKRQDISDLMQAIDLFVLPSRFEGFPLVLIEAQAAGLMCLVSSQVTSSTKLAPTTMFIPLEEELWAKHMAKGMYYNRICGNNIINDSGHDVTEAIGKLMNLYS